MLRLGEFSLLKIAPECRASPKHVCLSWNVFRQPSLLGALSTRREVDKLLLQKQMEVDSNMLGQLMLRIGSWNLPF